MFFSDAAFPSRMLFFPLPDGSPWHQHLCHGAPASSSAAAPQPAALPRLRLSAVAPPRRPGQHLRLSAPASNIFPMALRHGAPATNKPHPAEKITPVWLAIWHNWVGFANSQHRDAAFATPDIICAHSSLLQPWSCCSDIANLSAHLHRLPTPPPYLRRMRLPLGRVRRSCKSPRARILVLGTSGAHWPARWPQFELTERVAKS